MTTTLLLLLLLLMMMMWVMCPYEQNLNFAKENKKKENESQRTAENRKLLQLCISVRKVKPQKEKDAQLLQGRDITVVSEQFERTNNLKRNIIFLRNPKNKEATLAAVLDIVLTLSFQIIQSFATLAPRWKVKLRKSVMELLLPSRWGVRCGGCVSNYLNGFIHRTKADLNVFILRTKEDEWLYPQNKS